MDETFRWSQLVSKFYPHYFGQFCTPGCHGWFGLPKVTSPVPFLWDPEIPPNWLPARLESARIHPCASRRSQPRTWRTRSSSPWESRRSRRSRGSSWRGNVMDAEQQSATCRLMFFSDIYSYYIYLWYNMWYDIITYADRCLLLHGIFFAGDHPR